jgi:CheY-like chemotaxis protein
VERTRKAVTERIRTTLARVEKIHPALGDHLRRSLRTGTYCSYDPAERIDWALDGEGPAPSSQTNTQRLPDVLIVDDHPLWRETLRKVLEHAGSAVVAEASDGVEALEVASRRPADVVLMDIDMPEMDGIEATRRLVGKRPDAKVLVLSSSDERDDVIAAVAAGASGYLLKTADASEIVDAVRRVAAGEPVFPPPLSTLVLSELRAALGADGRSR